MKKLFRIHKFNKIKKPIFNINQNVVLFQEKLTNKEKIENSCIKWFMQKNNAQFFNKWLPHLNQKIIDAVKITL